MINIEQITSRLAKMPDQSLQQYAMMHKGDPYIIALAMSESKRRKDMRASAQAGPAQAQPKVVDQALAEMAPQAMPQSPDEAGIAALPAGDMNFADGGIVAFADGGGVERYQDQGLVRPYETPYDRMNRETREREAAERAERLARIEAAGGSTSSYGDQMGNVGRFIDQYVPDPRDIVKTLVQAPGYEWGKDKVTAAKVAPTSRPTEIRTPQQLENLPAPKPKPKLEAGLGGTREAAALRGPVGPSVQGAKDTAGQFLDAKGMRSDLDKYQTDMAALVEAARARREEGKPAGEAYSKYEESLKKEEAGAGKERDEAKDVAIFRLGVGMMAGTSPNAFKNIGDAAGTALTEYSGAIKDMKKATKKRQKAFGEIEQARRAESRDDWKAAQAFEDKAEARMDKAREAGIKGIMDITGKDAELAAGIYKTQVEQQGRMDVAQLQARTTLAAAKERGAGAESKEIAAAEAAFARDPHAKALSDSLKMLAMNPESAKYKQNLAALEAIRASKYKQFGITLEGAPGAARPGGTSTTGWGKAQVITP